MIKAPWTNWQQESIKAFQLMNLLHPFTCGNDSCRAEHKESLIINDGLLYCPHCGYTQDWVHEIMANWQWIFVHCSKEEYSQFKQNLK